MRREINWIEIEKAIQVFADSIAELAISSVSSTIDEPTVDDADPLCRFPAAVSENFTTVFYEPGNTSMAQQYIENNFLDHSSGLQRLMNDLYKYATRADSHVLSRNTILVLSQLPYDRLGSWADMLAVAATRSHYHDVQEMGIRCFENWESKSACEFLKACSFSESWLQEYADEVYAYVMEEGNEYVLPAKNITWSMAGRGTDHASNTEGYRSRYSSSGVPN